MRVAVWSGAGVSALPVGFSRVYLGVHYLGNVLAGYTAAFVWVMAVAFGGRLLRRVPSAET